MKNMRWLPAFWAGALLALLAARGGEAVSLHAKLLRGKDAAAPPRAVAAASASFGASASGWDFDQLADLDADDDGQLMESLPKAKATLLAVVKDLPLEGSPEDTADMDVAVLMKTLRDAQAGKADPKEMKKVSSMLGAVKKLLEGVTTSNNATQKSLDTAIDDFDSCKVPKNADAKSLLALKPVSMLSVMRINATPGDVEVAQKSVNGCKKKHKAAEKTVQTCDTIKQAVTLAKKVDCKIDSIKPVDGACKRNVGEAYGAWLERMRVHFVEKYNETVKHRQACDKDTTKAKTIDAPGTKCAKAKAIDSDGNKDCQVQVSRLKVATCSVLMHKNQLCTTYTTCYKSKVDAYNKTKTSAKGQVASQKLQWRLLKRFECLAGALQKSGKVDKAKLGKCSAKKKHDTSHLDLKFPDMPAEQNCTKANPEWKKNCFNSKPKRIRLKKKKKAGLKVVKLDMFEVKGNQTGLKR